MASAILGFGTGSDARLRGWYRFISIRRLGRRRALFQALAWPLVAARGAVAATKAFGGPVTAETGLSRPRQAWQAWYTSVLFGHAPESYYLYRLFRDENRRRAGAYIGQDQMSRMLRWLASRESPAEVLTLSSKDRFDEWCRSNDLPLPDSYGSLANAPSGSVGLAAAGSLPRKDPFTKPSNASQGRGARGWAWDPAQGLYSDADGRQFTAEELMRALEDQASRLHELKKNPSIPSGEKAVLLIQERLTNHPDLADLSPAGVCPLRVITMRSPAGAVEILSAVLRIPPEGAAVQIGGYFSDVDLETGMLSAAVSKDPAEACVVREQDPRSGAPIAGRRLPMWPAAVALVTRAHGILEGIKFVGWDVVLTPRGPVLLEANVGWGTTILQIPRHTPLAHSRFVDYYLQHCANLLDRPPADPGTRVPAR